MTFIICALFPASVVFKKQTCHKSLARIKQSFHCTGSFPIDLIATIPQADAVSSYVLVTNSGDGVVPSKHGSAQLLMLLAITI